MEKTLFQKIDDAYLRVCNLRDIRDNTPMRERDEIIASLIDAENELKELQFQLSSQID